MCQFLDNLVKSKKLFQLDSGWLDSRGLGGGGMG